MKSRQNLKATLIVNRAAIAYIKHASMIEEPENTLHRLVCNVVVVKSLKHFIYLTNLIV